MRDIKFRAWDKEGKVMVDWFWLSSEGDLYETPVIVYDTPHLELERNDDLVAMQYTGKKDINGVEIYEGDILQNEHHFRYQVVFKGDCWRCESLKNSGFKNRFIGRDLKVIGNIYQNKDLLED